MVTEKFVDLYEKAVKDNDTEQINLLRLVKIEDELFTIASSLKNLEFKFLKLSCIQERIDVSLMGIITKLDQFVSVKGESIKYPFRVSDIELSDELKKELYEFNDDEVEFCYEKKQAKN